MRPENLVRFAAAIRATGGEVRDVVGFIDGTMQPTCRPYMRQDEQRLMYWIFPLAWRPLPNKSRLLKFDFAPCET
ncbi:hypothetical protein BC941DRAFT_477361 [Chlamydoabsidia padenii]|nr:hypothetical protein BC941DRAFT_477361 [Chlamydoabsidia padenii]